MPKIKRLFCIGEVVRKQSENDPYITQNIHEWGQCTNTQRTSHEI